MARTTPLARLPGPYLPVWLLAEHSYCEKRIDLWLRDPGSRVSVPRQLEYSPAAQSIEDAAAHGRNAHEVLAAGAVPVSSEQLDAILSAGITVPLLESPLQAGYRGLSIVGKPDAVILRRKAALLVLDYKFTGSRELHMSDKVQLLIYGYLLEQSGLDVASLQLACLMVPPESDPRVTLNPHLANDVHSHVMDLVSQRPNARSWRSSRLQFDGLQSLLRVFPYSRQQACKELDFVAEYWLGHRPPKPTTRPVKCSSCLYNSLGHCDQSVVPYSPPLPGPTRA